MASTVTVVSYGDPTPETFEVRVDTNRLINVQITAYYPDGSTDRETVGAIWEESPADFTVEGAQGVRVKVLPPPAAINPKHVDAEFDFLWVAGTQPPAVLLSQPHVKEATAGAVESAGSAKGRRRAVVVAGLGILTVGVLTLGRKGVR